MKNKNPVNPTRIHMQVNAEVVERADRLVNSIRAQVSVGVRPGAVSRATVLAAAVERGLGVLEKEVGR